MIPKKIHYCWYSEEPVPHIAAGNLANWQKVLGEEYEIIRWDAKMIAEEIPEPNEFLKHAIDNRNYAFMSDMIRYFAVAKYGGIYLDMDVRLYRNFDNFLEHSFFAGWEYWVNSRSINTLTAHCFGAVAHHPYVVSLLASYNGPYNEELAPIVMRNLMVEKYGITDYIDKNDFLKGEDFVIYPFHYFDRSKKAEHFEECVAHHQHMNSWRFSKIII